MAEQARHPQPPTRVPAAPVKWLPVATLVLAGSMLLASVMAWRLHARTEAGRLGALQVGEALPELVLVSEDGPVGLYGQLYRNGLTLLVFYSSTCEVCSEDLHSLLDWLGSEPPPPLRVIVIADTPTKPEGRNVDQNRLLWFQDPGLRQVRQRLRIGAVPSYVVANEEGNVLYLQRGRRLERQKNVLLTELEHLLAHHRKEDHEH